MCLSCTDTLKVPNAVYKCLLEAAGLGEKKLVIPDIYSTAIEFNEDLIKIFPKLRDAGGFEFLRCVPNSRDLELIDYKASMDLRVLKQKVGSGRLYIRPIQKGISMDPIHVSEEPPEKVCVLHNAASDAI